MTTETEKLKYDIIKELVSKLDSSEETFFKYVNKKSKEYAITDLHWICRYATKKDMIMLIFNKYPDTIGEYKKFFQLKNGELKKIVQLENNGDLEKNGECKEYLPTTFLAEWNLKLAVEFAREIYENDQKNDKREDRELSFELKHCLYGIDFPGKRNYILLEIDETKYKKIYELLPNEDQSENAKKRKKAKKHKHKQTQTKDETKNAETLENMSTVINKKDESHNQEAFYKQVIDRLLEEDINFIMYLMKNNYLNKVIYERLHIILPRLLESNDSGALWFVRRGCSKEKCEFINKMMKDFKYDEFLPEERKHNICEREKDLLIWCCFSGRFRLVDFLSRNSQFDVIPLGIFCSQLIGKLSTDPQLPTEYVNKMRKTALICLKAAEDTLEVTILQCSNPKDKNIIMDYLELKDRTLKISIIKIMAENESYSQVVSVMPLQEMISRHWYGVVNSIHLDDYFRDFPRFVVAVCSFEWLIPINMISWLVLKRHLENKQENKETNMMYPPKKTFFNFVKDLYQTPYIKCVKYIIQHVAFLLLFAYVLLSNFETIISPSEIACCVYVFANALEEGKQLILGVKNEKLKTYFINIWNIFDLCGLVAFIIGFTCRWYLSNLEVYITARFFYTMSLLFYCVRLFFLCTLFHTTGSLLKIIREIFFKRMGAFGLILLLFVVPYGIAYQSMLLINDYGNKADNATTIFFNLFDYGFFAMVGELQLEVLKDEKETGSKIAYFFLLFYVFITNIVLLNLLIALFSKTVDQIEDDEDYRTFRLLDRLEIVKEFKIRSAFACPLNVIQMIVEIIMCPYSCKYSRKKVLKKKKKKKEIEHRSTEWNFKILQAAALHNHRMRIGNLYNNKKKSYFKKQSDESSMKFEEKLAAYETEQSTSEMLKHLEFIKKELVNIEQKIDQCEKKIDQCEAKIGQC